MKENSITVVQGQEPGYITSGPSCKLTLGDRSCPNNVIEGYMSLTSLHRVGKNNFCSAQNMTYCPLQTGFPKATCRVPQVMG